MYTRYTCIYTIYTHTTPLTTPYYTPYTPEYTTTPLHGRYVAACLAMLDYILESVFLGPARKQAKEEKKLADKAERKRLRAEAKAKAAAVKGMKVD